MFRLAVWQMPLGRTLEDYADLAAEGVKQAVREAGDTVRDEIRTHAPKDTGDYAKAGR